MSRHAATCCRFLAVVTLVLLVACGPAPTAKAPQPAQATATPAPTNRPAQATATPAPTNRPASAEVVPTPPTAPPATATPAPPVTLASPTATPPLPAARFDETTLPAIRPLRAVGFGAAQDAAIAPDSRLLVVATTAGLAYFELPSLHHLRFDPIAAGVQWVTFDDVGQTVSVTTGSLYDPQQVERRSVADGRVLEAAPAAFHPKDWKVDSPTGAIVVAFNPPDSSPNPGVRLARAADGAEIYRDEVSERIAFSADESLAAAVTYRGDVRLITLPLGAVRELELPAFWVVAFSPDAQTLVAAGRKVWLWDVTSGELRQTLTDLAVADDPGLIEASQQVRYSADGSVLSVDGDYGVFEATLRRSTAWRVDEDPPAHAWDSDAGGSGVSTFTTYVGATSPTADIVATTDDGHALTIRRAGAAGPSLQSAEQISALSFSPDGALLAVGDAGGNVRLVRVSDGTTAQTLVVGAPVYGLAFSPDGALLGARTEDGAFVVWRVGAARPLARIGGAATGDVAQQKAQRRDRFRFTADGALLVAWGPAGVRFHRLSDGALLHRLPVAADDVAVGPRRRLVAILSGGRVELWGLPLVP